jgi:hypothetical protein
MSTEGSVLLTSSDRASPNEHAQVPLYPFRFDPIYEYRPWGGRQLAKLLREPLPAEGPIGEAWALSDRPDFQSRVSDGPLKGMALHQLLEQFPDQVMGMMALPSGRFPLLLKFLDVRDLLSVQVHPSDEHADYLSEGETGKTEAWVVLQAEPESRIYAGLRPGTSREDLQRAVDDGTLADNLACFSPRAGDAMLIPAGTVHALGLGVVVFEVQQNSDITFRLYDWGHVDPRTGLPRPLQVDQAIACTDFDADTAPRAGCRGRRPPLCARGLPPPGPLSVLGNAEFGASRQTVRGVPDGRNTPSSAAQVTQSPTDRRPYRTKIRVPKKEATTPRQGSRVPGRAEPPSRS